MSNIQQYPVQVSWSDEDEGFIAVAPDLAGCSAFGKTQAEAIAELQSAIEAWIEAAKAAGNPIPEPSQLAAPSSFSGKFLVRVPRTLHSLLAERARRESVSLNQLVVYLLSGAVAGTPRSIAPAVVPEEVIQRLRNEIAEREPQGPYRMLAETLSSNLTTSFRKSTPDFWETIVPAQTQPPASTRKARRA